MTLCGLKVLKQTWYLSRDMCDFQKKPWRIDMNRLRRACAASFLNLETPNDARAVA